VAFLFTDYTGRILPRCHNLVREDMPMMADFITSWAGPQNSLPCPSTADAQHHNRGTRP